jgi:maltose/maltodextrin transport system permease protein
LADIAVETGGTRAAELSRWFGRAIVALIALVTVYGAFLLYTLGQPLLGVVIFAAAIGFAIVFGAKRYYTSRFIFPGIVSILIFVVVPVIYTIYLGFTNYSSFNLLSFERVQAVLLSQKATDPKSERPFSLVADGAQYRIYLGNDGGGLLSGLVSLDGTDQTVATTPVSAPPPEPLPMREVIKLRDQLGAVTVATSEGAELKLSGLRTFAAVKPEFILQADGRLVSSTGAVLTPDHSKGFYVDEAGNPVPPGWRVNVGLANFKRIAVSEGIREPMAAIFVWTMVFATLSVGLTFALGLVLASILQWPHLRFKGLYRVLLILPYSVPGFISILVFKGLFNQNFGEINMILDAVFQGRPSWNTDPMLARTMILIVNIWLGYPYMMLLAMGFLQSVPEDHKKAAALEGANPLRVFFSITLPQILPPFLPLLIASFAFNFNNLVLVLLLTRGLPDMPGTLIPAGQTDILGSFTYRISFMDSGQQFGLAGAITLVIFVIVTAIAYANFLAMRRAANAKRFGT